MSTGWALSFGIEGGVACVDLGHGAEREPPAWLAHEIARHSRLPRPDDSAARAREGGAFLATSRRPSGAASARPVVLHFYSLACRDGVRRRRRERSISFKIRKAANEGV